MYKFLIFFLICFCSNLQAQEYNAFEVRLNQVNGQFKLPKGYSVENEKIGRDWCWDGNVESGVLKTLSNSDRSILVGISIAPYSLQLEALKDTFIPVKDTLDNFEVTAKSLSDTLHSPIRRYDASFVSTQFNADKALEFSRACTVVYRKKYTNNRVVMIGKNKCGFFKVNFLYTDAAKDIISEEIEKVLPVLVSFQNE